jgi:hypothetical protein
MRFDGVEVPTYSQILEQERGVCTPSPGFIRSPQVPDQDCEFDCDSDSDSELGLDNREDNWTDTEKDSEDELSRVEEEEEEMIVDMDDMYGPVYGPR